MSLLGLSNCNHLNPPWVCTGNPDDTSTGDAWRALLHAAEAGGAAYPNTDTFGYDLVSTTAQALNMVPTPLTVLLILSRFRPTHIFCGAGAVRRAECDGGGGEGARSWGCPQAARGHARHHPGPGR